MSDDFHTTLERLREARDEIERDFDERLTALDGKVREAREALEHAALVAAVAEPADQKARGENGRPPGPDLEAEPWPSPGGLRGRIAGWLLGEYLDAVDRRHRQLSGALERAEASPPGARGVTAARVETIRELAGRATEAAELAALGLRRMKELLNAKEAETVHVATHGARAQAELTLAELARQQEALLSELVGRRQQLERLLEGAGEEAAASD